MKHDRRAVLRAAAVGLVGASAGCLDGLRNTNEAANAPSTTAGTAGTGSPARTTTETGSGGTATTAAESDTTATRTGTETGTSTGTGTEEASGTSTDTASATTGGTTTPGTESTATATCDDGLRRLDIDFPANFELAYRTGFGFELSDPGDQSAGDSFAISLRNTTDEPQVTGPQFTYAIERQVEDGWRHVLQVPDGYTPSDERVTHEPDEGFDWEFEASREGFSVGPYTVCAPLQSGVYHFTYYGFTEAMRGLTIEFEIE